MRENKNQVKKEDDERTHMGTHTVKTVGVDLSELWIHNNPGTNQLHVVQVITNNSIKSQVLWSLRK